MERQMTTRKNFLLTLSRDEIMMTAATIAAVLEGMKNAMDQGDEMPDYDKMTELYKKVATTFASQDTAEDEE
jgi:hypothetical protein